jgi:hypothetical protein
LGDYRGHFWIDRRNRFSSEGPAIGPQARSVEINNDDSEGEIPWHEAIKLDRPNLSDWRPWPDYSSEASS